MPDPQSAPAPTGAVLPSDEVLQRIVNDTEMAFDGVNPLWGAFWPSSHDRMMSTSREVATLDEVFAVFRADQSAGVWPVPVAIAEGHNRGAYGDAGQPCGCPDPDCERVYPAQHASIDLRGVSRRDRERFARACLDEALERGPIHLMD